MDLRKYILAGTALVLLSIVAHHTLSFDLAKAHAESAQNLMQSEDQVRAQMLVISRQLGVTCNECHDVQNFKDGSKKNYQIGREHIQLVELLRGHGLDGKKEPQADCYMCHRGKLMPDYKEPAGNVK